MSGSDWGTGVAGQGAESTYYQLIPCWVLVVVADTKEQEVFPCEEFIAAEEQSSKLLATMSSTVTGVET